MIILILIPIYIIYIYSEDSEAYSNYFVKQIATLQQLQKAHFKGE